MKTYIISNGRRYSDHEVLFVEAPDDSNGLIPRFIEFCARNQGVIYGVPHVMGMVEGRVTWRAPNSSMSVLQFFERIADCVCTDEDAEQEFKDFRRAALMLDPA